MSTVQHFGNERELSAEQTITSSLRLDRPSSAAAAGREISDPLGKALGPILLCEVERQTGTPSRALLATDSSLSGAARSRQRTCRLWAIPFVQDATRAAGMPEAPDPLMPSRRPRPSGVGFRRSEAPLSWPNGRTQERAGMAQGDVVAWAGADRIKLETMASQAHLDGMVPRRNFLPAFANRVARVELVLAGLLNPGTIMAKECSLSAPLTLKVTQ